MASWLMFRLDFAKIFLGSTKTLVKANTTPALRGAALTHRTTEGNGTHPGQSSSAVSYMENGDDSY